MNYLKYFTCSRAGRLSIFAAFLLINVVTSGCTLTQFKEQDIVQIPFRLNTPSVKETFSPWHHESFDLCTIVGDELDSFVLPQKVNLWDRVREGFALETPINKRIQQEINWYSRHPSYMSRVSNRAAKYLYFIVEELDKRDMPMEIALLPIVESAYDPFAYSFARASGMWQFVPATAKSFGLKQNWWYDGRRDVVEATRAALDYLEYLHKRFDGNWMHALAAYNSGSGRVSRAIRKNKAKGLGEDYWQLDLPRETEGYVPKLFALKALVERPDVYSISLASIPNEPYFHVVPIDGQIDLAQAAEMAEMSMQDFYLLNPAFNRWATDPDGPHQLVLPVEKAAIFQQNFEQLPKENRVTWDRYTIKEGDALSTIAKKYRTTVGSLQAINNIQGHNIRAGKTILVPIASKGAQHYVYSSSQRIAQKQSNGKGQRVEYVVKSGDSFWSIANRYKVSTRSLAKWNGLAPKDTIKPGQKLVIWTGKTSKNNNSGKIRKVSYKVRNGDSLARIASKFNIRIDDIVAWNTVNPKAYIQPGDMLTLFVDITKASN